MLELYYQRWRPGGAPRAVLAVLHGFGEHSGRYGNVVDWFVPRGYAVYAFDMRGHGRSSGKRGHFENMAQIREDVRIFLDLVRQEEPDSILFLLGHSQGGLAALNYVLHDPSGLAGVIASGPLLEQMTISPAVVQILKVLSKVAPGFTVEAGLDVDALSRDTAVVRAYVDDPLVHGKMTLRMGTELMKAMAWTRDHAAYMALPCLLAWGSEDRLCAPQANLVFFESMTLDDKESLVFDGYYHEIFNDLGKEKVLADVESWLERHL